MSAEEDDEDQPQACIEARRSTKEACLTRVRETYRERTGRTSAKAVANTRHQRCAERRGLTAAEELFILASNEAVRRIHRGVRRGREDIRGRSEGES